MEDQTSITLTREQLLIITSAIILAGIASNYKTSAPSSPSHAIVAVSVAKDLMDRILKEKTK